MKMNKQNAACWRERAAYIDTLLHLKHTTYEKKFNMRLSLKRSLVQALRRQIMKPKVYNNPFIQFMLRVRRKLKIKL